MVLYAASAWAGFTVFEVARKAHGPEAEKPGLDSYSSLWGPGGAAAVNLLLIIITAAGATGAGYLLGMGMSFGVAFVTATAVCAVVAVVYARRPSRATAKLHYLASSLFLLAHSVLPAILVGLERGVQFTRDL
jgi:4-hydroxybenzoate polyprenyltransferase